MQEESDSWIWICDGSALPKFDGKNNDRPKV